MKKLATFITAVSAVFAAQAQDVAVEVKVISETQTDTIVKVVEPECTEYCEADFNFEFPFQKPRCSNPYNRFQLGIPVECGAGLVGAVNSNVAPHYRMGNSWEFFISRLVYFGYTPVRNGPRLSAGFGLWVKNLESKDGRRFIEGGSKWANTVGLEPMPEGSSEHSAHLRLYSVTVPFTIEQRLAPELKLQLSAVMNVPTTLRVTNKYHLNGDEIKRQWDTNAGRPINWDFMGAISYDGIGIYVKYSPYNLFRDNCGPKVTTVSTGLIITDF